MNGRRMIEELVPRMAPNAVIVSIDETERNYEVTMAGTTGVTARCDLPREVVDAAEGSERAWRQMAVTLKRCADDVVAEVPDGRG